MIKKNYKITIGIVFCALIFYFLFIYFHSTIKEKTGLVAITSISSEGNYALTTDNQHNAVLWDLKNKTKKIISTNANLYSAYWIKNTPYFMWQELHSGNVPIENAQTLKVIKKLKPWFLIFGQAMGSDLKYGSSAESVGKLSIN